MAHDVKRTDAGRYHWDEEHQRFFEFAFGVDLRYRKRTRICSRCRHTVVTVELPQAMLSKLIGEIGRMRRMLNGTVNQPWISGSITGFPAIVELIADVFGENPKRIDLNKLTTEQISGCKLAVDACLFKLSEAERAAIVSYYGLPWNFPTAKRTKKPLDRLLRQLKHPNQSRLLRRAYNILWPE